MDQAAGDAILAGGLQHRQIVQSGDGRLIGAVHDDVIAPGQELQDALETSDAYLLFRRTM